jgi:hypothetical protein
LNNGQWNDSSRPTCVIGSSGPPIGFVSSSTLGVIGGLLGVVILILIIVVIAVTVGLIMWGKKKRAPTLRGVSIRVDDEQVRLIGMDEEDDDETTPPPQPGSLQFQPLYSDDIEPLNDDSEQLQ